MRDPELDEPVTALGFVASCTLSDDGTAEVHLRLPTYFCAPNFAYLMVADAHDAVCAVPGVRRAVVVLDDHFAADAINAGVAARAGFLATFGDQAAGSSTTCAPTSSAGQCSPVPTASVDRCARRVTPWRSSVL